MFGCVGTAEEAGRRVVRVVGPEAAECVHSGAANFRGVGRKRDAIEAFPTLRNSPPRSKAIEGQGRVAAKAQRMQWRGSALGRSDALLRSRVSVSARAGTRRRPTAEASRDLHGDEGPAGSCGPPHRLRTSHCHRARGRGLAPELPETGGDVVGRARQRARPSSDPRGWTGTGSPPTPLRLRAREPELQGPRPR